MKANEAPEKIYVNITHPISNEYTEIIAFEDGDGIEYTRTDVFIEKACDYLQKNLWRVVYEETEFRQRFVTDFENYMKGE